MTGIQQILIDRYLPMLEKGVEHVATYSVDFFYRYANYLLYSSILQAIGGSVVAYIMFRFCKLCFHKYKRDTYGPDEYFVGMVFSGVIRLSLMVFLLILLLDTLPQIIFVPEVAVYQSLTK